MRVSELKTERVALGDFALQAVSRAFAVGTHLHASVKHAAQANRRLTLLVEALIIQLWMHISGL